MPTAPAPTPAAGPDTTPTMCLLHADFHVMDAACWGVTFDWYFAHQHLSQQAARDQYLAEVERAMLDALVQRLRLPNLGGDLDG